MSENSVKRKLTAILCADVKGYSRMMGEDEVGTFHTLSDYLKKIQQIITSHNGKVFSSPGDAILAQFASVVDAVECAVKIQKKIEAKNADVPKDRKMRFRIGVNLGDVIEKEEQIYGDGVNIAARIETLAEPGGVSISRTVYNHVHNKLKFGYESQGEHQVKNIAEPIRVYQVLTAPEHAGYLIGETQTPESPSKKPYITIFAILGLVVAAAIWYFYPRNPEIEPASVEKMAYPLPDKPSIAVLPFDNMSNDPDQEYFADGISENIISALSHIPGMFVIARNSTFSYKGKPVKVQQVSEELGVRYILEGSVQRSGDQIRVTAQLVDATTGHHLWSERYDREQKDLFDLQDEITLKILAALQIKLTGDQQARLWSKTDNLEAWGNHIKGSTYFEQYTKYNNSKARELYQQAVKLDPAWEIAWTMLAWTHWAEVRFGWSESPAESMKSAVEFARKATAINDTLPETHSLWSNIYLIQGDFEKAITEGQKAVTLGPSNALCHMILSYTLTSVGRFNEAIKIGEKALRLSPYSSSWYLIILDDAYRGAGRYEEALAIGKRHLDRCHLSECNPIPAHLGLAATYIGLGKVDEARAHVTELVNIEPGFSLDDARKMISYRDPVQVERALDILRQAGLPEHSPLPLPDKPSIAVLAFDNLSGDPEQQYFSDGITEQIITSISKVPYLFVVARQSSFAFRDKQLTIQQIAKELGVRYILEGSLQRSGERLRINAQLIDATSGHHLWAESYDHKLDDIFSVQDDICKNIMVALQVKLTTGETARIYAETMTNIRAYEKYLKGLEHHRRRNKENSIIAQKLFQEAITLDPGFISPYILLGWTYLDEIWFGITKKPSESIAKAEAMVEKVNTIKGHTSSVYSLLCSIYQIKKDIDKMIDFAEKAIEYSPNDYLPHYMMGMALRDNGQYEEAISSFKKSFQLNPHNHFHMLHSIGMAYNFSKQYEKAKSILNEAVERNPDYLWAYMQLVCAYWFTGLEDQARQAAKHVLRINPKFSVGDWRKRYPGKDEALKAKMFDAWRKAGLPE